LRTLKLIFNRYTAWVWMVLKPLGSWGVFAIGFIDSAFFGLPLDPVVAGYVYANHALAPLYVVMASAGSAVGSVIIYVIGRKGGELLIEKRVGKARLERLRDRFERQEFFALMVPSMLPPPTPFKLFLLAAGAFKMYLRDFLLAIFLGRVIRFTILAVLTIRFGPQVVGAMAMMVERHTFTVAVVLGLALAAGAWWYWKKGNSKFKIQS